MFDSPIGRILKVVGGLAIVVGVCLVVWQVLWQDIEGTDRESLAAVSAIPCPPAGAADATPAPPAPAASPDATPRPSRAITIGQDDRVVYIRARLEEGQPNEFSERIRVGAARSDVTELAVLTENLERARCEGDDHYQIRQQDVTFGGGVDVQPLSPGRQTPFEIQVRNIPRAGVYSGDLRFQVLVGDDWVEQEQVIYIVVEATDEPPVLEPDEDTEAVVIQLVNCQSKRQWWRSSCWLSRRLAPAGATDGDVPLRFRNPSASDVTITDVAVDLTTGEGEQGGDRNIDRFISVPSGWTAPAQEWSTAELTLDRDDMEAGHYTGGIDLTLGDDTIQTIPLDLSVRDGALWPLVAIAVGVLAGLMARLWRGTGAARVELEKELADVRLQLAQGHPDDQKRLGGEIAEAMRLVASNKVDKARAKLKDVSELAVTLAAARLAEAVAQECPPDPRTKIATQIESLRRAAGLGKVAEAKDALGEIEKVVISCEEATASDETAAPSLTLARGAVTRTLDAVGRTTSGTERRRVPSRASRWAKLIFLGSADADARSYWTWLGFLVKAVTLGALIVGGLITEYRNDPTFGNDFVGDYLALVVWGFGADAGSRLAGQLTGSAGAAASASSVVDVGDGEPGD